MSPKPIRSAAVILAAGGSSRMRQPKQLLPIKGEPLLARTIRTVSATPGIDRVFVVLGADSSELLQIVEHSNASPVINPDWLEGLSTSVKAGLRTATAAGPELDSILFCLADQPYLSAQSLSRLLDARHATPHPPKLVTARYGGHPGAPCWVDRSLFLHIEKLTGDQGLRPLFSALPSDQMLHIDLPELATDLDTPEDYQRVISDLN